MADARIDCQLDTLRAQGFEGSLNEMMLAWLQFNTGPGSAAVTVPDAWREMLGFQLGRGVFTNYHRNDWWYDLLGELAFLGTMADREFQFWCEGAPLEAGEIDRVIDTLELRETDPVDIRVSVVRATGSGIPLATI